MRVTGRKVIGDYRTGAGAPRLGDAPAAGRGMAGADDRGGEGGAGGPAGGGRKGKLIGGVSSSSASGAIANLRAEVAERRQALAAGRGAGATDAGAGSRPGAAGPSRPLLAA